ncbi:WNT1 inducible signaling pathway protein 2 [Cricetulus griseus]
MAVAAVKCVHDGWGSPVTIYMSATPARAWFVNLGQALVAGRPRASVMEEEDGSCEVNGHRYLDGETFQPNCRVLCRCNDGGFTCLPLCSEDVRLPSWDCPRPRRVEVPGHQLSGLVTPASADVPCPKISTAWGPCSTTCGLGIATRVSNQNRFCQLEIQRRLCLPRPCLAARSRSSWNGAF